MLNYKTNKVIPEEDLTDDEKLLFTATEKGDMQEIRNLLRNGTRTLIRNKKGHTPLHAACYCQKVEAVRILLDCTPLKYSEELELRTQMKHQSLKDLLQGDAHTIFLLLTGEKGIYDHLWNLHKDAALIYKVELIFRDYYAPVILEGLQFRLLQRILTFHWNRSHINTAESITGELSCMARRLHTPEEIVNAIRGHYNSIQGEAPPKSGSFKRRYDYVMEKLGVILGVDLGVRNQNQTLSITPSPVRTSSPDPDECTIPILTDQLQETLTLQPPPVPKTFTS